MNFEGFIKDDYIEEIIEQKNTKILEIVGEIGLSRSHYIEFKDYIKNDENIQPIIDSLISNNFEVFYSYFNMKKYYNKKYHSKFNYSLSDLSKTKWFRNEILHTIKSI